MGIVSYAQNLEDVMLWRVLGDVDDGFYVDIGAHDSIQDSVSLAFYENGWTGIDVEPISEYAERLRRDRPRNIVIEAVVTDNTEQSAEIYYIPNTGLSTLDREIARQHELRGYELTVRKSNAMTLDDVFSLRGGEIHWAKVDVEGHELQVIRSWKSAHRPWILVVEAIAPFTRSLTAFEWEGLLFEKGYKRVWFDGLNRFYLHEAHKEKLELFSTPPNLFDEFVLSGEGSSNFHIPSIRQKNWVSKELAARLDQARAETAALQADYQRKIDELEADRARILAEHSAWGEEVARLAVAREAAIAAEISELKATLATTLTRAETDLRKAADRLDVARQRAAETQADSQRRLNEVEADRARILGEQSAKFEEIAKSALAREAAFAAELAEVNAIHAATQAQAETAARTAAARLDEARERAAEMQADFQRRLDELEADRVRILAEQSARFEDVARATMAREVGFKAERAEMNARHAATKAQARRDQRTAEARLAEARARASQLQDDFQRKLDEWESDRARILAEYSGRFEEVATSAMAREAAFIAELSGMNARHAATQEQTRQDYLALEASLLRERDKGRKLEIELMSCQAKIKTVEQELESAQSRIAELQTSLWSKLIRPLKRIGAASESGVTH
jgi:FkbM family methyltransferase